MKTIAFVTLFLGLTVGIQTVEVAVDEGVASVQFELDGTVVQHFSGPPWKAAIDLGDELLPHRLVAVALDGDGAELDRAEQWLNLTSRPADARLWVERDDRGRAVEGGLSWQSKAYDRHRSVSITFDGEPLALEVPERFDSLTFPLPPHDPEALHLLSAEIGLPDGTSVRADAAFGGSFGEELSSELTAVPVAVDGGRRLRRAAAAGDWLRVDGAPRPVLAVDTGGADLYTVVDRSAENPLVELGVLLARRMDRRATADVVETEHGRMKVLGLPRPVPPHPLRQLGLHAGDRLFLVRPVGIRSASGFRLFGVSVPLTAEAGGTAWQLTFRRFPDRGWDRPQLLGEAVATVAMTAAGSGRPRGILLVLGPDWRDASAFTPAQVRRYLERLRVPLEVWWVDPGSGGDGGKDAGQGAAGEDGGPSREERLAAVRAAWGSGVRDVAGLPAWLEVNRQLQERLGRQRILWIEGRHPPSAVELVGAPEWVRPVVE